MTFSHIVSAFFTAYRASERGLAANPIASYSDVMKLLIRFACERFGGEPAEQPQWKQPLIMAFLSKLSRGVMSRNVVPEAPCTPCTRP